MQNFDGPEVQCGDCGVHFQIDPSGEIQGAACPECGGKRMFRAQPSPTKGEMDGNFTNDVMNMPGAAGSDSPGDPGGNPLGEGVIALTSSDETTLDRIPLLLVSFQACPACGSETVEGVGCPQCGTMAPGMHGSDSLGDQSIAGNILDEGVIATDEANPNASAHGYDGYTHSHVSAFPNEHDHPEEMMTDDKASGQIMCPYCSGQGCIKCGYQGYFEPFNFGTDSQGFNTPSKIDVTDTTHYPGIDIPSDFGPVRQGSVKPQINTVMNKSLEFTTHQRETTSMTPYPSLWEEPVTANFLGGIVNDIEDGAKAVGQGVTDVATSPIVDDAALALGEAGLAIGTDGAAIPEEVAADSGEAAADAGVNAAENGGQSLLQKGKSAIMNKLNPSNAPGGVAGYAGGKALEGIGMGGAEGMFDGGNSGNSGYATPSGAGQFYQYASLESQDIPMLLTADLETPGAVKSVDEQHDDPEQQDQKEFDDGDKSPSNLENPNNEDSGASGEDGPRERSEGFGLGPNTPGMDHMLGLMPLIMHYINNGLTAEDDPLIQELDQMLESEDPGYRNRKSPDDDKHVQMLVQQFHQPEKHEGRLSLTIEPTPVTNVKQSPMPNTDITPPQDMNQHCARCGSTILADGSCQNCGNIGYSQGPGVGVQQTTIPGKMANGQGPQTPEQYEAVSQYLQSQGQGDLIPQMYEHPENFGWALNEIQQVPNTPPLVQAPPPAPAPQASPQPGMNDPQGAMPVPDMSQPGGGSQQPMQPMAKTADANNAIPRCPNCGTATTTYVDGNEANDNKNMGHCHSCGKNFILPDSKSGLVAVAAEAFTGQLGTDPSQTWVDTNGAPLVQGQSYSLYTSGVPVPDEVEVVEKKPNELGLHLAGDFANSIGPKGVDFYIQANDVQNGKYSFEPSANVAQESMPLNTTPGEAQIGPSPTTDELQNTYPNLGTKSSVDIDDEPHNEICHKCGNTRISSIYTSPETIQHDCDRCLTSWVTRDDFEGREAGVDLSWLNEDTDFHEDMNRYLAMRDTSGGSRNISDIARRDPRNQMVSELLEHNKMQRDSGKKFTLAEQRDLINEEGSARQYENLDLSNTHYEVNPNRKSGNEYNVRDEDMGFF